MAENRIVNQDVIKRSAKLSLKNSKRNRFCEFGLIIIYIIFNIFFLTYDIHGNFSSTSILLQKL